MQTSFNDMFDTEYLIIKNYLYFQNLNNNLYFVFNLYCNTTLPISYEHNLYKLNNNSVPKLSVL